MKVLFTDLDGTLLNKKSSVTEYTRNILKEFTDQGNMVVPCSGRPLLSMQKLLESEGLSDITGYIIAYNGALVWDCAADKPVWESGIAIDTAYTIQNECITHGIHIQTYADEHIVTLTGDTEIDYYKKKIFLPVIFADDPVSVCKRPPYKLLRTPEKYTVGEIIELMEGTLSPVACLVDKEYVCPHRDACKTLPMWEEYDEMIHNFFYSKKLTDVINTKESENLNWYI